MKKALVTILILCLVSTICFVSNAQAASAIAGAAVSQNTVNGKLAAAIRSNNMFKACLSELKVEGVTLTDPVVSEIQGEILVNYFPVAPSEINTVVVRLDTSYNVLDVLIVRQSSDESYSVHSYATGITHLTDSPGVYPMSFIMVVLSSTVMFTLTFIIQEGIFVGWSSLASGAVIAVVIGLIDAYGNIVSQWTENRLEVWNILADIAPDGTYNWR